jgi:hypothetical protein
MHAALTAVAPPVSTEPQVFAEWPTDAARYDDDSVDLASIGVRRFSFPRLSLPRFSLPRLSRAPEAVEAVTDVARDLRTSLAPTGRADMKRQLRSMLVACLRGLRGLLDRVAELTVKAELKLRD